MDAAETPLGEPCPVAQPQTPNYLIIVDQISWISGADGQGLPLDSRFCRFLKSDQDACGPRRFKASPEWQPLDLGWLQNCSFLLISNEEGKPGFANKEHVQRQEDAAKILEISLGPDDRGSLIIRPGQSVRFEPNDPTLCRVRCLAGTCRYILTILPQ